LLLVDSIVLIKWYYVVQCTALRITRDAKLNADLCFYLRTRCGPLQSTRIPLQDQNQNQNHNVNV